MYLQPPFIVYSEGRPPFHDGMDEEHARVTLVCPRCSHAVERNVLSCLSTGTEWFGALSPEDQEAVAGVFGYSMERVGPHAIPYARFPNGSHAYLCTAQCPSCQSQYVLAIDFYEKQPARYIGVLQGAASLTPNELK
jgi:hypothetical protein